MVKLCHNSPTGHYSRKPPVDSMHMTIMAVFQANSINKTGGRYGLPPLLRENILGP